MIGAIPVHAAWEETYIEGPSKNIIDTHIIYDLGKLPLTKGERGASLGMKRVANCIPKIQIRDCVYMALIWYSLGLWADGTWRLSVLSQRCWFLAMIYTSVGIHVNLAYRFGFGRKDHTPLNEMCFNPLFPLFCAMWR